MYVQIYVIQLRFLQIYVRYRGKLYFYVRCLQIYVFCFFHNICRNLYTYCDIQKRLMIEKKLDHPPITTHIGKLMYLKLWDRFHPYKRESNWPIAKGYVDSSRLKIVAKLLIYVLGNYRNILVDNAFFEIKEGMVPREVWYIR